MFVVPRDNILQLRAHSACKISFPCEDEQLFQNTESLLKSPSVIKSAAEDPESFPPQSNFSVSICNYHLLITSTAVPVPHKALLFVFHSSSRSF